MNNWFLLNIDSTHKVAAYVFLNDLNVEFYSPQIKINKANVFDHDGNNLIEEIFPHYVFVFLSQGSYEFEQIKGISNLCNLVYAGSNPAVLSMGFINILKLIEKNKSHCRTFNKVNTNCQLFYISDIELKIIDVILDEEEGDERIDILMRLFEDYQIS